jgi:hypothetical protein
VIEQGVNHRILEMRSPPPRHERVRTSLPAFLRKKRRDGFGQAALHIHDGSIEVEAEDLDGLTQDGDIGRAFRNGHMSSSVERTSLIN